MSGYKEKYLKTYFWSGLALLLNFVSMFIVAPLTTSMPEAYGVYSLCISFGIFLRYADMGFIDAGRKYAAEAFSVKNHEQEKKYVGTSMSIYGGMILLFFLFALFFSNYPEYIIKDIKDSSYYDTAHQLLLILAFTFPISIIPKFNSLIYSIRIEEYRIQSFQIIASIIKIISVPLYFFRNRYDIVGYYLFCELINLLVNVFVLWYSRYIGYGVKTFFRCLRFDKTTFHEIMPLALSGFVSVIGWVVFYELDTVGISIFIGANAAAIYVVGKSVQTLIRSLVGIVFSPYPVRINYFVGQNDIAGLKAFFYKLVEMFSFITIPIIVMVLYAKPFIIAWVGHDYEDSIIILQLSVLTFILHHVTSQGCSVIYGLNKVKDVLKIGIIQPVVFWIGVFATYKFLGVNSFAIFKLVACLIIEFFYCYLVRKYLEYPKKVFYWTLVLKPLVITTMTCTVFWLITSSMLDNVTKGYKDLFYVIGVMGVCCLFALTINICYNKSLRIELVNAINKIINKSNI